jgi:hypothetical protein
MVLAKEFKTLFAIFGVNVFRCIFRSIGNGCRAVISPYFKIVINKNPVLLKFCIPDAD